MIKGQPCKVVDLIPKVKGTGPTANDRVTIKGTHVFTGKKMEDVHNLTQQPHIEVPVSSKSQYTLLDIDEDR